MVALKITKDGGKDMRLEADRFHGILGPNMGPILKQATVLILAGL